MRRNKYQTHVEPKLIVVEGWARDGLTDQQIAKNLGVAYSTFREYKKKYPAFSAVLKRGKEVVDYEVENALLKRALGFSYDEVTRERDTDGGLVISKVVKKLVVPDVGAAAFWLKNRRPEKWRDRPNENDTEALERLDTILAGVQEAMKK